MDGCKLYRTKLDRTGQALVDEEGNVAESQDESQVALLKAHFPKRPPGTYEPAAGGRVFHRVDAHLVGSLLAKAANTAAPGDDRIMACQNNGRPEMTDRRRRPEMTDRRRHIRR